MKRGGLCGRDAKLGGGRERDPHLPPPRGESVSGGVWVVG